MITQRLLVGDYRIDMSLPDGRVTIWIKGKLATPIFTGLERAMFDRIVALEKELGLDLI